MYGAFVALGLPLDVSTMQQAMIREQLYRAGEILRVLNNVLGRTKEFGGLRDVMRKCFVRIRYMMDESFDGIFKKEGKNESRYVGEDAESEGEGEGKTTVQEAGSAMANLSVLSEAAATPAGVPKDDDDNDDGWETQAE